MSERLTENLLDELFFSRSLDSFLEAPEVQPQPSLAEYLAQLLAAKGMRRSDVIRLSGLNTTFAYQAFSGERIPSRDKLLQLAIGLDLNIKETQRLLRIGDAGALYCKVRRDAIVLYCLDRHMTLEETEQTLYQFGEKTLTQ